jgi:hypothetical protein
MVPVQKAQSIPATRQKTNGSFMSRMKRGTSSQQTGMLRISPRPSPLFFRSSYTGHARGDTPS